MREILPLGDRALVAAFVSEEEAQLWAAVVRAQLGRRPGITDIVVAYRSVAIYADPSLCDLDELTEALAAIDDLTKPELKVEPQNVDIPVLYDGVDLPWVAEQLRSTVEQVISGRSEHLYRVVAIGFLPGFPYCGYLPQAISGLPRRSSPRKNVPAGSVAIAGRQTGVYPTQSPGGWHLVGRTPLVIADFKTGHFPLRAGDTLRFVPIDLDEYEGRRGEPLLVSGRHPVTGMAPSV